MEISSMTLRLPEELHRKYKGLLAMKGLDIKNSLIALIEKEVKKLEKEMENGNI